MPIARREMLVLARSPLLYRARLTTGLVTLVAGAAFGIFYAHVGIRSVVPFAGAVGYMLSMMCMFAGAQVSADSVAKEKREGTLGLLFLSGLSGWEITVGKLIAAGISSFYGIFVTFPLLSLLMIVGGVKPLQIVQMSLTLRNTVFASVAMGLFASTISLEQKRAAGRASMLVMFFWWGLPLLSGLAVRFGAPFWVNSGLLLFSMNSSFLPTMIATGLVRSSQPWMNLLGVHLLGWIFLGLAWRTVRREWQDKPGREKVGVRGWWRRLSYGTASRQRRLRVRLLDRNPFAWLASRDRLRALGMWIVTFVMIGLGAIVYFVEGRNAGAMVVTFPVAVTVIHRFMAVASGASQLLAEQEQGTLEMIFCTPFSARGVLAGQFTASARQMIGPVLLVVLMHLGAVWLWTSNPLMNKALACSVLALSLALYLFDLYTAIWLAMWGAVISRNYKQASGAAITRLIGTPFLITASLTILLAALNTYFNVGILPGTTLIVSTICVLMVGNNLYWLRRVRRELASRLRSYAFSRYAPEETTGLFAKFGRTLGRFYRGVRRH